MGNMTFPNRKPSLHCGNVRHRISNLIVSYAIVLPGGHVPLRLRFLLDTNILIPLQDSMLALQPSLTNFIRLCNAHGHQLLYHAASVDDVQRDANIERRDRTLTRLQQYTLLQARPACPWNTQETSLNDACDNEILYALEQGAAHALVTEDQKIHRKARERGLGDRVYLSSPV